LVAVFADRPCGVFDLLLLATGEALAQADLCVLILMFCLFLDWGLPCHIRAPLMLIVSFLVNLYGVRYLVKSVITFFERIPFGESIYGGDQRHDDGCSTSLKRKK